MYLRYVRGHYKMKYTLTNEAKSLGIKFEAPRSGDNGYDLYLASPTTSIQPLMIAHLNTGVSLELAPGVAGIVKDRSSMGSKGLHVLGGVVDSSYRGVVIVMLVNLSREAIVVGCTDKIAQMVFLKCELEQTQLADTLVSTTRGAAGFGSTGKSLKKGNTRPVWWWIQQVGNLFSQVAVLVFWVIIAAFLGYIFLSMASPR